jgi:diguanylate cyclase (GGDEF)-like protein/PAS domain S-box-containing protein
MSFFKLKKLSIDSQNLKSKLRTISMVLFLFPCTIILYVLHEQNFFVSLDSRHLLIFLLILVLAFAGIAVLRQTFNKFVTVSIFMKRAEAGEMVMMDTKEDSAEIGEITRSFNQLISRLDATGQQLEKLDSELKDATANGLRAEEALTPLKKAVDIMQIGVTITDMHRKIMYTNLADAQMHGYKVEELIGQDVRILAPPQSYKDLLPKEVNEITNWCRDSSNCRKDGSLFPVRMTSDVIKDFRDLEWHAVGIVTTCEDISERKRFEETLRLRQRVIESSSNGIMVTDCSLPGNLIIYVNPAFERITGYPENEALGNSMNFLLGEEKDQVKFMEICTALLELREGNAILRNYRKDGSLFWNDLSVSPVQDEAGKVSHFVWEINDVTEREQHEELLEHQANHDSLTGLPNRNLLADRLTQSLANARRYSLRVAVLFVDLDNFKFVNDSMGHAMGDRLLVIEADRLHKSIRAGDTVARYGGDEFVVVVSNLERSEDAAAVAQNIHELLSKPLTIDGHQFMVTCSIGISLYPKDGHDVDSLLKNADAAMYQAKEYGRSSFKFYTSEMNERVVERMTIERHLRNALEMGEFEMNYQPQVDLCHGRIIGVEALLRWRSGELGMVSPEKFIPLAEETGLIVQIGEWVLKTCCEQNKAWQNAGLPPLAISVNLSARQLQNRDLIAVIHRILEDSGLEARFLELEIVESMVMQDVEHAVLTMKDLKERGVLLAMDDFGTGFSSLSYLKRFPFDKLKIDLSFVKEMMVDNESAAIIRAIIAMSHSLNLRVIAEGVESEEQMEYLRLHECDEIQGYFFSPPLPAADFERLLREGHKLKL